MVYLRYCTGHESVQPIFFPSAVRQGPTLHQQLPNQFCEGRASPAGPVMAQAKETELRQVLFAGSLFDESPTRSLRWCPTKYWMTKSDSPNKPQQVQVALSGFGRCVVDMRSSH